MTTTLYDFLVKRTFSQIEHAAGLLQVVLPEAIAERVDFSTLALCPGTFVDQLLGGRHADLLFSVTAAEREVLIYVLFEHQSTVDAPMPFRLLQYMVRIRERHLQAHPDDKPWSAFWRQVLMTPTTRSPPPRRAPSRGPGR